MTTTETVVSIHDFTLTVDTKASDGDRLVVHFAREGHGTLTMAFGAAPDGKPVQFMWLLNDPEYFAQAYRFAVFKLIAERRDEGVSFAEVAAELGVDAEWAQNLHREVLASMTTEASA